MKETAIAKRLKETAIAMALLLFTLIFAVCVLGWYDRQQDQLLDILTERMDEVELQQRIHHANNVRPTIID